MPIDKHLISPADSADVIHHNILAALRQYMEADAPVRDIVCHMLEARLCSKCASMTVAFLKALAEHGARDHPIGSGGQTGKDKR